LDLLDVRSLPFLARRNYYYEFKHLIPWSVLAGLVEGEFSSIVIARTFDGDKTLIALSSATPAASYLFSLLWGMLCLGRPKIRLLTLFSAGTVLFTGVIGAIPTTRWGAFWFVAQMGAAQILLAGVVTIRSAVWKSNYPRAVRGRIVGRLQAVRFITSIVTLMLAARVCDYSPSAYRFVFPAVATFGLLGVFMLHRIRIRGERGELRRHQITPPDADFRVGFVEPFSLTALLSPGRVFGRMFDILKRDRRFARYCLAQSYLGTSNFMTIPVMVAIITQDLDLGEAWGFWISTALIQVIPHLFRLGSLGRWGRLFDRIGVVRFRVYSGWCWVVSLLFGTIATVVVVHRESFGAATLPLAVTLFGLRGIAGGIALGGGSLAWVIGHLHFAKPDEAEVYMGVHVFLTGVRGLFAPALGMVLWHYLGWPAWLIAVGLCLTSLAMYWRMAREERAEATGQGGDAAT